jgi:heme-degrading monooxygenase HmoA
MITRIWHGWTTPENAAAYQSLLETEVLPGIAARGIAGYRGVHLLRRDHGPEVEFVTVMWFDSLDCVRAFAGEDYETAHVPPKARALLSRFDERSAHYETVLGPLW